MKTSRTGAFQRTLYKVAGPRQGIDAQHLFAVAQVLLVLNQRILNASRRQTRPEFVRIHLLREGERDTVTPDKISAESAFAAMKAEGNPDQNDRPGGGERGLGQLHEIELGCANEVKHRHGFEPASVEEEIENHPSDYQ